MENTASLLDLLALYQSDLGSKILSYATAQDLCTIDLLSKQFQAFTAESWQHMTKERFGMNNGKEGWRLGTSFLREPVYIHPTDDEDDDIGFGWYGCGSAVAANESMIVGVTAEGGWEESNDMGIRDASTLEYIRTQTTQIRNYQVSICGQVGSEIIVTSNKQSVWAIRGNFSQRIVSYSRSCENGIKTLGSEGHLIWVYDGSIDVYTVNSTALTHKNTPIFSSNTSVLVDEGRRNGNWWNYTSPIISWGPDKSSFIVGYPHQMYIWDFDAAANRISLAKTITTGYFLSITNVALSDDYIVACSDDRRLHVWECGTGEKVHGELCDEEEDIARDIEEEVLSNTQQPLQLIFHGHILVSTSFWGCKLCIWNIKTGQLLAEHNDAEEEHTVDLLPMGVDPSGMVYLNRLNGILCMTGFMNIWSFPTNQKQHNEATSIRLREEALSTSLR